MISVKEASKGLGPKQKTALQELVKARDAAHQRVKELEELRARRMVEQANGEPEAVVLAGKDPARLAQGLALADAYTKVIEQIDRDLAQAQQEAAQAGRALVTHLDALVSKRRRIEELDTQISRLQGERDKLAAALAA